MKYKIGDVARILGTSTDLLRYYEKKGVVTPTKDKNNDYRYYDAWDINFLMDCLWFKNFGFSIEMIADMVRIPSVDELANVFESKEDELRSNIRRLELLLRRSEQHRRNLGRIPELLQRCEIAESPDILRYLNRVGDEYPVEANPEPIARKWLAYMPFNNRYFEISAESLMSGSQRGYRWGFALDMEYAEELDFSPTAAVIRRPPRKSIHTIFRSRGKGGFSPKLLGYALDFAKENDLRIMGAAGGILLASTQEDSSLGGYFEAWIPVEE